MKKLEKMLTGIIGFIGATSLVLSTPVSATNDDAMRLEAENGRMTGTVRTENFINDSGATVSFIDNGPENSLYLRTSPSQEGDFFMKIRYRSGEMRNLMYRINDGKPQKISHFNSGSWNRFSTMTIPVSLAVGQENTIQLYAPDKENGPGIDWVEIIRQPKSDPEIQGYRLIFQDEFHDPALNTQNWVPQYLSSWSRNPELAMPTYTAENGLMRLQIFEQTQPWCEEFDGQTIVSGFTTGNRNGLHNWNGSNIVRNPVETEVTHLNQYGYYEMRAKGQPGSARHVAWWLLGLEDIPEESAEIDIFEILGRNSHKVPVNFHSWNDPDAPDGGGFTYTNYNQDYHNDFHTYGLNWEEGAGHGETPDKMTFFVDGIQIGEREVNIDYPLIQLLSIYEKRSGGWTGIWTPQPYPNTFDIDYVRVYKKIPGTPVPAHKLEITDIQNPAVTVLPSAVPRQYTSQVPGHEGEIFTDNTLPGVRSYVNVTYNDGVITQEFVRWNPLTEAQFAALASGSAVTVTGEMPNLSSHIAGYHLPTLTLVPTAWDTNLTAAGIENLFDGDTTSTPSCWTQNMDPMPENAYISYRFPEAKEITGIDFSANYGNGQGIRSFYLSFWDSETQSWKADDTQYLIPWTDAGDVEEGETVHVALNTSHTTSAVKIHITGANTQWDHKIVMREIAFTEAS